MRTGAVVFLLLLMAVPVRASASPPGLEALYEFAPELGDRRHAGTVVRAAFRHLPVR